MTQSRRSTVAPTVTETARGGKRYDHPAYAMIGASRVSHSPPGTPLVGTDFLHQNYVVVRIHRSCFDRDLSRDWHHARDQMIEVALSEAQWASFVSSMNVGDGVPCTLTFAQGEGYVPGLPHRTAVSEFTHEVREQLQACRAHIEAAKVFLEGSKPLGVKAKAELLHDLEVALSWLDNNVPYVERQFGEHVERTVTQAHIEISAYIAATLQRVGLNALTGESPVQLPTSAKEDPQ